MNFDVGLYYSFSLDANIRWVEDMSGARDVVLGCCSNVVVGGGKGWGLLVGLLGRESGRHGGVEIDLF